MRENISIMYPNICDYNMNIIQEFCNHERNHLSVSSYQKIIQNIYVICDRINATDVLPFNQWDVDVVIQYFGNMDYSYNKIVRIVKMVKDILSLAQCHSDLSLITAQTFLGQYRAGLFSFDVLNNIMKLSFAQNRPMLNWETMNDVSTSVVICYLEWLGFNRETIAQLKRDNYHANVGVMLYDHNGKTERKTISNIEIEKYFNEYVNSSTYLQYNSKYGKKLCKYNNSDSFIKGVYTTTVTNQRIVDNYILKIPLLLGVSANEIWTSGRLNDLYILDVVQNYKITMDNICALSSFLKLKSPVGTNKMDSTAGRLIMQYDSYKTQRQLFFSQN